MTDAASDVENEEYVWDPDNDPDGYTRGELFASDQTLDTVLAFFGGDAGETSISMTFVVDGVLVSGTVITREAWQKISVDSLRGGGCAPELLEGIDKIWTTYHEIIEEKRERREAANMPPARDRFFHMKNVRVGSSGAGVVTAWRGLRSEVSGWSLGAFTDAGEG